MKSRSFSVLNHGHVAILQTAITKTMANVFEWVGCVVYGGWVVGKKCPREKGSHLVFNNRVPIFTNFIVMPSWHGHRAPLRRLSSGRSSWSAYARLYGPSCLHGARYSVIGFGKSGEPSFLLWIGSWIPFPSWIFSCDGDGWGGYSVWDGDWANFSDRERVSPNV